MHDGQGFSAAELSERCRMTLSSGDGQTRLTGAARPEEATGNDLVFVSDEKHASALPSTRAGAVIVPVGMSDCLVPVGAVVFASVDPEMSFIDCLELLYPGHLPAPGVHQRAAVDDSARIGAGTSVGACASIAEGVVIGSHCVLGPGCHIGAGVRIGDRCVVHANATLCHGVTLHDDVIVHSGTVIGADGYGYKFRDGVHRKFPQVGTVVIESGVEIGANTCIDRAALGATRIGVGSKLDNLVHVAHNVQTGRGVLLLGQVGIGGSTSIGDYAIVASQGGITDHVSIGRGAKILARAGVTRDVPDGEEVFGFPALPRGQARREIAALRRLAQLYKPLKRLVALLPGLEKAMPGRD